MSSRTEMIHWLGSGLASVPGIRRLIAKDHRLTLWEQDIAKAETATRGLSGDFQIRKASGDDLAGAIQAGDIVVSMLPASMHVSIAELCIEKGAHFVSSSYITEEMRELDAAARAKDLSIVNEVGLDPGIDHLLAHLLIDDYRSSPWFDVDNRHAFKSYCGGFPAIPNAFKYKFSWSPLGVLKALKSPARMIRNGAETLVERPWDAVEAYPADLAGGIEMFQSYPNRDSLPFMSDYGFGKDWKIDEFVRGTLRLNGWAEAWSEVFETLSSGPADEDELAQLSDKLWADHAYQEDEMDRVVLSVELKVMRGDQVVWHKAKSLDSHGNVKGSTKESAMARLVSIPVSLATEAILAGDLASGVQSAPHDPAMIRAWLETIAEHGDMVHHTDYCMKSRLLEAAE